MKHSTRQSTLAVLAAATALVLAACAGSTHPSSGHDGQPGGSGNASASPTPAGPVASGTHSQADVAFATDMIPHHAQAVTMADLALTKATNPKVKELASGIKAAQDPEIKTLSGWLVGWSQPLPATAGGHNMSAMAGGMMSEQEMEQLSNATGATFDRLWLQLMIKHHQGAVAMAQTELTIGTNLDAKKLAQTIIDGQTKEIVTMADLLPSIRA